MITQQEYIEIYKKTIYDLKAVQKSMMQYKKYKTDLRGYSLVCEIDEKIKTLTLAYNVYTRPDLQTVYKDKDYTSVVRQSIGDCVSEYDRICRHIKAFENITEYHNNI